MVAKPQARQRVEYKKPRRINVVSVTLVLILVGLVWVGDALMPGFLLKAAVKEELRTRIITLYRANLNPDVPDNKRQIFNLKGEVRAAVQKLGVTDPNLEVHLEHNKKLVVIEVRFTTIVQLRFTDKKWTWSHSPRVEMDAARVDW